MDVYQSMSIKIPSYAWNKETTLKFIRLYKERPLLWNPAHPLYRHKQERTCAISEIGGKMGLESCEVTRKLRSLVDKYMRELKKEETCIERGSETYNYYASPWFAYDAMSFLKTRQKKKPGSLVTSKKNPISNDRNDAKRLTSSRHELKRIKKTPIDDSETKDISERLQNLLRQNDDAAIFGDYIAEKIRSMDQMTRTFVEHELNSIMFKADMGHYHNKSIRLNQ